MNGSVVEVENVINLDLICCVNPTSSSCVYWIVSWHKLGTYLAEDKPRGDVVVHAVVEGTATFQYWEGVTAPLTYREHRSRPTTVL